MKKTVLTILLIATLLFVSACDASTEVDANTETQLEDKDNEAKTADLDTDGDADISVDTDIVDGKIETEVKLEFDDQMSDEAKEAIADVDPADFCQPGTTYTYESAEGNVDSEVIGLTTYEGAEFCQATSQSTIETPIGSIATDSTYYFDATYKEYWVETTVSGSGMPTQTNIVHLVDGVVEE